MSRTLHLLRHAEALPGHGGSADEQRPLSPRGRRQADALAVFAATLPIDLVLCSPALRTRETLAPLLASRSPAPRVTWSPTIYRSCVEGLIDLLLGTPPDIRSVLFVGHNPTISELVDALAGPTTFPGFSPATRVTLEIPVPWSELSEGRAAIVKRDVRAADLP